MAVRIHLSDILGKRKMSQSELSKKQELDQIQSMKYIGN